MADGVSPVVDTNLGPAPLGAAGAVGLMSDLAEMRNRQNANLLFQQQMSARKQMGEDAAVYGAQGLNDDQILDRISKAPYAPFVAPEIGMFRQAGQARVGMEAQKLDMWHSSVSNMISSFAATGGDRSQWAGTYKAMMAGVPPEIQGQTKDAVDGLITSLTAGLPGKGGDWSPENQGTFNTRLRNLGVAFGMPLDKAYAISGGGIPPTYQTPKGPGGQEMPSVISGGGSTPAVASPVLQGGAAGAAPATDAPAPGSPIVGPTSTQTGYLAARGTDMADYQKSLDDRVKMGQQIMQTVQPAWEAIQDLKKSGQSPGGLQTARMAIAQLAQGLGAAPDVVDKISKLGDTQEFSKLMVNTTMSQISQQLPSMSKMAVSEYNSFTKNNPNLDTDPRAIEKIFNFWSGVQNTNRTEQTEMNAYLDKGGDISKWPAKWQEIAEKKGLVSSNPTGSGGAKERPPIDSFFK
jgi:hypothetical protein